MIPVFLAEKGNYENSRDIYEQDCVKSEAGSTARLVDTAARSGQALRPFGMLGDCIRLRAGRAEAGGLTDCVGILLDIPNCA